jgi:hypothetical protein
MEASEDGDNLYVFAEFDSVRKKTKVISGTNPKWNESLIIIKYYIR